MNTTRPGPLTQSSLEPCKGEGQSTPSPPALSAPRVILDGLRGGGDGPQHNEVERFIGRGGRV